jgi:nucleotide-binding universal stress UspA family protein
MFQKVVVAYNESPESQRALLSAIRLAKSLNAELQTITAMADLPAYTAYAEAADPSLSQTLQDDRLNFYRKLQDQARVQAENHGIELHSHLLDGQPVEAIVDFLRRQRADLLVIGLHQRELHISRLWSTVYELAQDAPCSVLGVH